MQLNVDAFMLGFVERDYVYCIEISSVLERQMKEVINALEIHSKQYLRDACGMDEIQNYIAVGTLHARTKHTCNI